MKKLLAGSLAVLSLPVISFAEGEKDWSLHAEVSYVKTSGNSNTDTFAVKAEAKKQLNSNRFKVKADALYAKAGGKETANRWYLLGRWDRSISSRLFGFLQGDYLKDKFAGFDYRTVWLAGLGYEILKTKTQKLKGLFSLGYSYQSYFYKSSESYPTASFEINYEWDILENLTFKEDFNSQLSLDNPDLYYINSDTSVKVNINKHFSLGVGYRVAYQNKPPSPDLKKTDTTFLTSLIVDY